MINIEKTFNPYHPMPKDMDFQLIVKEIIKHISCHRNYGVIPIHC